MMSRHQNLQLREDVQKIMDYRLLLLRMSSQPFSILGQPSMMSFHYLLRRAASLVLKHVGFDGATKEALESLCGEIDSCKCSYLCPICYFDDV